MCDTVVALWRQILQHAFLNHISDVAVECAKSEMITHVARWTIHCAAERGDEDALGPLLFPFRNHVVETDSEGSSGL